MDEWSIQNYSLQDLKDAVKQAVADDKARLSNRVKAAFIAELPELVQGLPVHAYQAILRGAEVPESWHETIVWLMPKGTTTRDLDAYRPIASVQQDMRMLMTPLMRRFTAAVARKGVAADWQLGAMPGSTAAAPVFLAQRRLQGGQEENHVVAFDVSKAFDTAPHGALALLLRHMGVPEEVIMLLHTFSCGSTMRIVMAHCPTPSIRLHRGLRQGSAERAVLHLLLLEPLLRSLARKAQGFALHAVPPMVHSYCDDLLLIAHSLPQFPEYAAAVAYNLADMVMSLNVGKRVYTTTTRVPSIMVHVRNAVTPWVYLVAMSAVPYLCLMLDPKGMASMREKHVLRCESLLGCMAAVVGGILRYAVPYLSDTSKEVVMLNVAIKTAALQFENLFKDVSNVVVRCGKGLKLADIRALCRDSVPVTLAHLTHHRLAVIKGELRAMLDHLHTQYASWSIHGSFHVLRVLCRRHVGRPSAQSDGEDGSWTPHAVIGVLVRAHPSAAGAMGWTAVGDTFLHLQG